MDAVAATNPATTFTVFEGTVRIAMGPLDLAVRAAREAFARSTTSAVLIFDDLTGDVVDVDYNGPVDAVVRSVIRRLASRVAATEAVVTPRGPGRPRLGVVAREVTLLPRHWQWLNGQPGGASVALRRLVDEARKSHGGRDRVRRAQEVSYRVMSTLGGNLPGFEEAIRGLFARDRSRFEQFTGQWPADVRSYVIALAAPVFEEPA